MVIQAAIRKGGLALGYPELKAKQVEAMSTFLKEKDTFVSLPTGLDSQSFMQPCLLRLTILKVCVYCTETSGHLTSGRTFPRLN